jgi:MFS family permease
VGGAVGSGARAVSPRRARRREQRAALPARTRAARRGVTLVFALNGALIGSWAVRIPAVKANLDLSDGTLGLALASIAAGSLVAMPIAGWLSATRGSRVTTRVTLVWFCIAIALLGLAPSLPLLVLATFNLGASTGSLDVAMNAHGVEVERRHPYPILSSFHAAWSLGGLLGAAIGGFAAAASVDVGVQLAVGGAIGLAIALPISRSLLPADADSATEEDGPLLVRPPRALWALGVLALCGLVAEGASGDWSAVYMKESLGTDAGLAAVAFAGFSAAMTIGRLAGDRLTEAWGPVALVRRGGLLGAVGIASMLLLAEPWAAIVGFICLGFGLAGIVPAVFRAAAHQPGISPGVALGAVSTMGYVGFLGGPPIIGGLAELTSLPTSLWLLVALALAIAALAPHARPADQAAVREPRRTATAEALAP